MGYVNEIKGIGKSADDYNMLMHFVIPSELTFLRLSGKKEGL
ncbi:MAG: hypothetical protein U0136_12840 [Bdellovibrionota bacterium]